MGPGATGTGKGGRIDFEADGPSDIVLKNRIPVSLKQGLLFGKIHLRAVKGCKLGVFVNQYRSFLESGRSNPGIGQGQSLRGLDAGRPLQQGAAFMDDLQRKRPALFVGQKPCRFVLISPDAIKDFHEGDKADQAEAFSPLGLIKQVGNLIRSGFVIP
jgi:hypothetical protein